MATALRAKRPWLWLATEAGMSQREAGAERTTEGRPALLFRPVSSPPWCSAICRLTSTGRGICALAKFTSLRRRQEPGMLCKDRAEESLRKTRAVPPGPLFCQAYSQLGPNHTRRRAPCSSCGGAGESSLHVGGDEREGARAFPDQIRFLFFKGGKRRGSRPPRLRLVALRVELQASEGGRVTHTR